MLNENGFSLKINCPTRVTTKSATCIDHIATNIQTEAQGVVVTDISDHMPVFTAVKTSKTGIEDDLTNRQKKLNEQQIGEVKEQLSNVDWSIINRLHLDDAYGLLVGKVKETIKEVKDAKPKNKKNTNFRKPWITKGLQNAIKKRELLYKNFIQKRTEKTEKRYKNYRNHLDKIIKNVKKDYYHEELIKAGNNSKRIWSILNKAINKKTAA